MLVRADHERIKHNTHEAQWEKLNSTLRFKTEERNSLCHATWTLYNHPRLHGRECAALLTLSDVHCIINSSWHCRIVVAFAVLTSGWRQVVALLSARCFAFGHASLHRRLIDRVSKLLSALARVLTWQRCIVWRCGCGSVAWRYHVKLHARQRITNWDADRLLRHLQSKRKKNVNLSRKPPSRELSPAGTRRYYAVVDKCSRSPRQRCHKLGKQFRRACTEWEPSSDDSSAMAAVIRVVSSDFSHIDSVYWSAERAESHGFVAEMLVVSVSGEHGREWLPASAGQSSCDNSDKLLRDHDSCASHEPANDNNFRSRQPSSPVPDNSSTRPCADGEFAAVVWPARFAKHRQHSFLEVSKRDCQRQSAGSEESEMEKSSLIKIQKNQMQINFF